MKNKKNVKINNQAGGITDKKDINAGSGAFNQGSEQDPNYNDGTKVSDEEKLTGHTPSPGKKKEDLKNGNIGNRKENPKDGNIGKNNAGGYK